MSTSLIGRFGSSAFRQSTTPVSMSHRRLDGVRFKTRTQDAANGRQIPLWVKSRHLQCTPSCPLYPQKRTCAVQLAMSALPPKADMCGATRHVRFVPIADSCTAAKHRYSITSSARPISVLGTLRPSALADFRLMYISTLVTCWTGRSAGLSPLRMRPV